MEKHKYDLSKYTDAHEEIEIEGMDKTKIVVRTHIPYEEKEKMAIELAERMIVIHDDSCVYKSHEYGKFKKYLVAKYYTDIDTEELTPEEVADYFINNEMWRMIGHECGWDYTIVEDIFDMIYESVKNTYEDDKSLTKAIRTSFGFLFNGEDITESLAKAEVMKDSLFEAVGALRNIQKEKEEKIDNGTLMVGGNIINFAKKKKE